MNRVLVCQTVFNKLVKAVEAGEASKAVDIIDATCEKMTGKEKKVCSNIGALPNSPTRIVQQVARYITSGLPPFKICEKLAQTDPQICEYTPDQTETLILRNSL
ncbi:unnamed protein product [Schistocephalus solidus]|uniref:ARMET N-terminal domain-containing protein n=1 Tax=Schistocephalus solidus TaxID=70667 RepID=A0A3P7CES2_SCHSO|nr:unnamed protein product [Schistocephalus solidus]